MTRGKKINIYKKIGIENINPGQLLSKYINKEKISKFPKISIEIQKNHNYEYIRKSLFPKKFSCIGIEKGIEHSNTFYRSLYWILSILISYSDVINKYIGYKMHYERAILVGDYFEAEKILNNIDNDICCSIWSLKNHILLKNLNGENIQTYINSLNLINEVNNYAIIFSSLTNINIDYNRYITTINDILSYVDSSKKDYYKYLFSINDSLNAEYSNDLLICSTNIFTIIDLYNLVKYLLRSDIMDPFSEKNKKVLNLICSDIYDEELLSLQALINNESLDCGRTINKILKYFEKNDYKVFINDYFANFKNLNYPVSFLLIQLLANCINIESSCLVDNYIKKDSIFKEILISMSEIIYSNNYTHFHIAIEKLMQYSKILNHTLMSNQIKMFIDNYVRGSIFPLYKKCYCRCDLLIIEKMNTYFPIFPESINKVVCTNNISYNDIETLFNTQNKIFNTIKKCMIYNLALKNKELNIAFEVISELIIENNMAIYNLETRQLDDYIEQLFAVKRNINSKELVYIFSSKFLKKYRKVAYKNFLFQNKITEPLEINKGNFEKKFIIYFLRDITRTEMLELLYNLFISDDDIDNYRMDILKYLIKIDEKNTDYYSKEISRISKNISLRVMQQDIDESKLSVDFEYIKNNIFDRFSSKIRMYFDTPTDDMMLVSPNSALAKKYYIINTNKFANTIECEFIGFTRHMILQEMFDVYAKEFCFGHKGLDTFLSTRVRHGIFSNEITNVFNEYNIINFNNDFYINLINNDQLSNKAILPIKILSEKLEELISIHTGKTFKVFIDDPIEGAIFNYNINMDDLDYILYHKNFKNCDTVQGFIDIFADCILNKTNIFLDEIKNVVLEKLNANILNLLDEFLINIKPYCQTSKCYDDVRNNVILCKTDVQKEINDIKNWFNISTDDFNIDYTWEDLIDVTKGSLKKQSESFSNICIETDINSTSYLKGESFSYWYDIFQIAIYNALQHSKYENLKRLRIDIHITETENEFNIFFINNVSSKANRKKIILDIERINKIYQNNEFHENVNREGGMGLIKIMHILFSIMNLKGDFFIDFKDSLFILSLKINKKGVIREN